MMRGVIVAKDQMTGGVLPVVTITEPGKSASLHRKRLADFKKGAVREVEPDAEVGSCGGQELFPVLLDLDSGEGADCLLDLRKVVVEGVHAAVLSRSLSSWKRLR